MKSDTVILLTCVLLTTGCTTEIPEQTTTSTTLQQLQVETNLLLNREIFHSNELMNITVLIQSSTDLENAYLRVYGIKSRTYRLEKTQTINLSEGLNAITVPYRTPRCTGCAGISPGGYEITADLIYENKTISSSTITVQIRQ